MGKVWVLLDVLANFVAIAYRHEHVGKHQVRLHVRQFPHCGFAIAHSDHVNSLVLQGQSHHLLDIAVVVRNQDLGHRTSSKHPRFALHPSKLYWSTRRWGRQSPHRSSVSEVDMLLSVHRPVLTGKGCDSPRTPSFTLLTASYLPGQNLLQAFLLAAGFLLVLI